MIPPISSAALGCREPTLGAQARATLGRPLAPSLQEHVGRCLACQLERVAFERFERASEPDGERSVPHMGS